MASATSTGVNASLAPANRLSSSNSSCRSTFAPPSDPLPKELLPLEWLRLRLIEDLLVRDRAAYTTTGRQRNRDRRSAALAPFAGATRRRTTARHRRNFATRQHRLLP